MLIPPDRIAEEPEILSRIRRGERIDHFDTKRLRKDGRSIDISLTISPVRDASGQVVGASKIARDITDQKQLHDRQGLLVEEMKHRIKNTLSTVQAIAMQTLRGTSKEDIREFVARLHSLSGAHDVLTRKNWNRASLFDLVNRAVEPFQTKDHERFDISGPEAWLDAARSTVVTMALHELSTNASKYGALSSDTGRVSICWRYIGETSRTVEMAWRESKGPTVVAPTRHGFGSRLIEGIFKTELGNSQLQFLPEGVTCTMILHCTDGTTEANKEP